MREVSALPSADERFDADFFLILIHTSVSNAECYLTPRVLY